VKKQLRDDWVKALRSGVYQQTTGTLSDSRGYCCLGVLCVVADIEPGRHGDLDCADLRGFRDECGLGENTSFVTPASIHERLVSMNDADRKPFPEIADWIEQNIPAEDAP